MAFTPLRRRVKALVLLSKGLGFVYNKTKCNKNNMGSVERGKSKTCVFCVHTHIPHIGWEMPRLYTFLESKNLKTEICFRNNES
jgi:hypothetical protein